MESRSDLKVSHTSSIIARNGQWLEITFQIKTLDSIFSIIKIRKFAWTDSAKDIPKCSVSISDLLLLSIFSSSSPFGNFAHVVVAQKRNLTTTPTPSQYKRDFPLKGKEKKETSSLCHILLTRNAHTYIVIYLSHTYMSCYVGLHYLCIGYADAGKSSLNTMKIASFFDRRAEWSVSPFFNQVGLGRWDTRWTLLLSPSFYG